MQTLAWSWLLVGVQGLDDFGDGGDVVLDERHAFAQHRAHALGDGEPAEFFGGGPADDQSAELGRDAQQLVNTDPVAIARAGAVVAAGAAEELRLVAATTVLAEGGELVGTWGVRLLAGVADPSQQTLTDHTDDRRRNQEGFDAHVEEAVK